MERFVGTAYGATCRGTNLPDIEVCGKTGTAQNKGKDHSIFMGFAPMNKPKIAYCRLCGECWLLGYVGRSLLLQCLMEIFKGTFPQTYEKKK